MGYYPIFLELQGRPCLVIGGGTVAYRKVKALIACGARIKVVSPQLGAGLKSLVSQRKIRWGRHPFRPSDLDGVKLVVAATDDERVNTQAARGAKKKGIFINVVDRPKLCSFIVPSVIRRGKLVLAISTGGISPALAKRIRQDMESRYDRSFAKLLHQMARVRQGVLKKVQGVARRKRLFEEALKAYFRVIERG